LPWPASVRTPVPSTRTSWTWNWLRGGVPGGAPSKAIHRRSGDREGRFAFCWFGRTWCRPDPFGRILHNEGYGDSLQYTISVPPPSPGLAVEGAQGPLPGVDAAVFTGVTLPLGAGLAPELPVSVGTAVPAGEQDAPDSAATSAITTPAAGRTRTGTISLLYTHGAGFVPPGRGPPGRGKERPAAGHIRGGPDGQGGSDTLDGERQGRFELLYHRHAGQVYAYARRRCGADDAPEVVADTFLVAWRRLDDVPADALPWLFVVARNVIANHRRSAGRRKALQARLEGSRPSASEDPVPAIDARIDVWRALDRLPPAQREALLLVAWERLDVPRGAEAAGCSRATFSVRLHRARRRLMKELRSAGQFMEEDDPGPAESGPARAVPEKGQRE
jgi:RNA polymerase sigma factor (sigma-70 family)